MTAKSLTEENVTVVALADEANRLLQQCQELLEQQDRAEKKFKVDSLIIDRDFAELTRLGRALTAQSQSLHYEAL